MQRPRVYHNALSRAVQDTHTRLSLSVLLVISHVMVIVLSPVSDPKCPPCEGSRLGQDGSMADLESPRAPPGSLACHRSTLASPRPFRRPQSGIVAFFF